MAVALLEGELRWCRRQRGSVGGHLIGAQPPLRREEQGERLATRAKLMLDPHAFACQLGKRASCVLVGLAEQTLAVDGMQRTAEEPAERQSEACELLVLTLDHVEDHLLRG